MKKVFLYTFLLLIAVSCSSDDSTENPIITYKIMAMGDSRVDGSSSLQGHRSYRYDFWKNLVDNGWSFNLIGPETDLISYPSHQNLVFDPDHAGFGGWRSSTLLDNFTSIIDPLNIPDIVLLGIGGNDLTGGVTPDQVAENINLIIDFLQALNSEIIIVVEQIAPAKSDAMSSRDWEILGELNSNISVLANAQATGLSTVVAVDMASGWSDSYLLDRVHYTAEGAKVVADRYYSALASVLNQ
ncbi:hypothetical protein BFP97_02620 [Roseivirga sp. 4D4]|uniref:SGNH/GDSL hydrolase family protein n=1 Tax=Roseivirga sp. 4D4 TaxID=1889784 RepID=UPI000853437F|nr:SGNH/GDSL hydrolase family protein [Roseivirga sp. 4D4]OEK00471.1 hypothetical protein BFP97_02620 [Roseivirga sp. 4D4]